MRQNFCRGCFAADARDRRRAKRNRTVRAFVTRVRHAHSVNGVRRLCDEMLRKFRGPSAFAEAWFEQFEAARSGADGPVAAGRAVGDLLVALSRLSKVTSEAAHPVEDEVALLTDADLERELRRIVEECPEELVSVDSHDDG